MREDRAAGVHQEDAFAVLESFDVRIAADEDIDEFAAERGVQDLGDRARFGPKLVRHADTPAFDIEELPLSHSMIDEQVVVPFGDEHVGELGTPIEDRRGGNVSGMKNQVHTAESFGRLGAEFIEVTDERGKVGVGDKPDAHKLTL